MFFVATLLTGLAACTGAKQQGEAEGDDSLAVAELTEETAEADAPKFNAKLFGTWNNNADPNINMVLAEIKGNYDGNKGYGYLSASNEYFEIDLTLVFTSIEPDGDNIKVHYDEMQNTFTGDPDDFDSEGEWVTEKVGEGEITVIPQGAKVKLDSKLSRIKNAVLTKTE